MGALVLSLNEALLGFLEVDDVPNGVEVLEDDNCLVMGRLLGGGTYVGFDILVLCRGIANVGEMKR